MYLNEIIHKVRKVLSGFHEELYRLITKLHKLVESSEPKKDERSTRKEVLEITERIIKECGKIKGKIFPHYGRFSDRLDQNIRQCEFMLSQISKDAKEINENVNDIESISAFRPKTQKMCHFANRIFQTLKKENHELDDMFQEESYLTKITEDEIRFREKYESRF